MVFNGTWDGVIGSVGCGFFSIQTVPPLRRQRDISRFILKYTDVNANANANATTTKNQ